MKQGRYGSVKRVQHKGKDCVSKTSLCVDHSIELECDVIRRLETLNISHYPRLYSRRVTRRNQYSMIMEYVGDDRLSDFHHKSPVYNSLQRRALIAAAIFNEELGITHNDLHTSNIMVRDVKHDIDRYVFPDGKTYEFRTYNKEPVIIDFGMAYDGSLRSTSGLTDIGIFPFEHDPLADARRLYPKKFPKLSLSDNGCFESDTFRDLSGYIIHSLTGSYESPIRGKRRNVKSRNSPPSYDEFVDLFVSKAKLTGDKPQYSTHEYKTLLSKAYIEFYRMWNMMEHDFSLYDDKMAFLKTVIDHSPLATTVRYKNKNKRKDIPIENVQMLKTRCNKIVDIIQDIINHASVVFTMKKQYLYSTCRYKKARDLIRQTRISSVEDKKLLVRSYDVKTRTITFYSV